MIYALSTHITFQTHCHPLSQMLCQGEFHIPIKQTDRDIFLLEYHWTLHRDRSHPTINAQSIQFYRNIQPTPISVRRPASTPTSPWICLPTCSSKYNPLHRYKILLLINFLSISVIFPAISLRNISLKKRKGKKEKKEKIGKAKEGKEKMYWNKIISMKKPKWIELNSYQQSGSHPSLSISIMLNSSFSQSSPQKCIVIPLLFLGYHSPALFSSTQRKKRWNREKKSNIKSSSFISTSADGLIHFPAPLLVFVLNIFVSFILHLYLNSSHFSRFT